MLSARELEFLLYEHPAVWDVAVIKQADEQLAVFVKPRAGQQLDEAELVRFCRSKLGEVRIPVNFFITDNLPKTKTGKLSPKDLLALMPPVKAYGF